MVTGVAVREARLAKGWKQGDLAKKLGVSQGYVSLVEQGRRLVSARLARKLALALALAPTALPTAKEPKPLRHDGAVRALGSLGYPGFARFRSATSSNPAETLLNILVSDEVEARVVKALPWLLVQYPHLDWRWAVDHAKVRDVQNRLGFVLTLAREWAERRMDKAAAETLRHWEQSLENSKLQKEDAFAGAALTESERRWLRTHRSPEAAHWNVLASLSVESLDDGLTA